MLSSGKIGARILMPLERLLDEAMQVLDMQTDVQRLQEPPPDEAITPPASITRQSYPGRPADRVMRPAQADVPAGDAHWPGAVLPAGRGTGVPTAGAGRPEASPDALPASTEIQGSAPVESSTTFALPVSAMPSPGKEDLTGPAPVTANSVEHPAPSDPHDSSAVQRPVQPDPSRNIHPARPAVVRTGHGYPDADAGLPPETAADGLGIGPGQAGPPIANPNRAEPGARPHSASDSPTTPQDRIQARASKAAPQTTVSNPFAGPVGHAGGGAPPVTSGSVPFTPSPGRGTQTASAPESTSGMTTEAIAAIDSGQSTTLNIGQTDQPGDGPVLAPGDALGTSVTSPGARIPLAPRGSRAWQPAAPTPGIPPEGAVETARAFPPALPVSRLRTTTQRIEHGVTPALEQAHALSLRALSAEQAGEAVTPRVNNTFNVNVAVSDPQARAGDTRLLEEALVDLLRNAARRQGLEV